MQASKFMLQTYLAWQSPLAAVMLDLYGIYDEGLTWQSALALGTDLAVPTLEGLQALGRIWKYRRAYLARDGAGSRRYLNFLRDQPGHHPIPKFMGGDDMQRLVPEWMLPDKLHKQYHSGLNRALRAEGFPADRARQGGEAAWKIYMQQNPGSQMQAFDILIDYTRKFDAEHGTTILRRLEYNLGLGRYRAPN
jgi:hypothetical protein